jgi:Fe-S-cluster containining protein
MHCKRCGVCCTETEMLLSKEDIARLEKKGYRVEVFARFDKAGYATLQNRDGYCFFYNARLKRCVIYSIRPSGCRVYPVIFDEDQGVVADIICPSNQTVTEQDKRRRGKRVVDLLEKIDAEAKLRRSE